jgi:hypothetical protein
MEEARLVFASSLNTTPIVLHELVAWPDRLAAIGSGLHGDPQPSHNAITLGNHIYFPIELATESELYNEHNLGQMAWLIHELTHCWQFQHSGISYFLKALSVQLRLGSKAYAYGWESGLKQAIEAGDNFSHFNPEQQGEITRHYYYRLKQSLDTSAWRPWIQAIQATGTFNS